MPNAQEAWRNAETRVYEYLLAVLWGEDGVTGFHPDDGLPRTASALTDMEMWTFEISGGGEAKRQQTSPMQSWLMGAMFRGVFTTRELAQRIAGLLMDNTPVTAATGLTGIQYVTPTEQPTITRDVYQLANDLSEGGETRVFLLEYPLEVVFNNTLA